MGYLIVLQHNPRYILQNWCRCIKACYCKIVLFLQDELDMGLSSSILRCQVVVLQALGVTGAFSECDSIKVSADIQIPHEES